MVWYIEKKSSYCYHAEFSIYNISYRTRTEHFGMPIFAYRKFDMEQNPYQYLTDLSKYRT